MHQNAYVYPVKTSFKGWGLCAGEPITKGTFIMQYVGEVFYEDSDLGKKRQEMYKNSTCTYMMRTENGEVIDPTFSGSIARFINHSCDPNCVTRKWTVEKETMVGIFARKDIVEDEELSFDYQFDSFRTPFSKCYCGTTKCKGYLGLGIYEDSDSDVDEKRNANSPNCQICNKMIMSKNELLLCKGICHSVFHLECAIKIDKTI
jgi:histone-lysine N-methyltransferase SETD2/UMP-CMP kinase